MVVDHPEATPERRALSRAVQSHSWGENRHGRRKAIALGYLRRLLADHPDDLADVIVASVGFASDAEPERAS